MAEIKNELAETWRNAVKWLGHRSKWGRKGQKIVFRVLAFVVLLELSFVFIMPILYIMSTSAKSVEDYLDTTIGWIPSAIHWFNYSQAMEGIYFSQALANTLIIAAAACFGQVLSCAVTGYGFGRYKFPGSGLLFGLVLVSFIVPPQTIIISLFALFNKLGWINTYLPFIVPAFFAHGIRGALFILIFRQFFRGLPKEMEEAARIDGAGAVKTMAWIMFPLAKPAIFVVAVFSFVWHWNDYYEPYIYLNREKLYTLPVRLDSLGQSYKSLFGAGLNEPVIMAACFLVVAPMLLLYMFSQRFLTEGIARTGIVE